MKHLLIFAALTAGAAHADSICLQVAGTPVLNAYGDCWQVAGDPVVAPAPRPAPAVVMNEEPRFEAPQAAAIARPVSVEVLFEFDGHEIRADGRKVLDDLAQRYIQSELRTFTATAHADRLGGDAYNMHLAARRAHAVREYLIEKGIPESSIQMDVAGNDAPVARCDGLGEENRRNLKLVSCLQPDRRVAIEAAK